MLDHTSQRHLFRILLALFCFCLQMPGTYSSDLLRLDPPSIVVLHGSSASVNCTTNVTHNGMGWEASQGPVDMVKDVQLITWTVENLTHWDIKPICYINVYKQDELHLNITVYKPPDQVSISIVNHTGPMSEGTQYELQCDVQNVAPVHLLFVKWYKGQQLVKTASIINQTERPVNTSTTLQITPGRGDDGVQYRCEAELNLGPEGPQPPPVVTSDPLDIIVHFGPEFSNCPDVVQLNEGESLAGYCNVTGNPFPDFYWEKNGLTIDPAIPFNRTSSGEYKIIINGNTTRILKVEVKYGPEISCGLNNTVQEGEYFKPNCTVVGYPPIKMFWYKHGEVAEFPRTMNKNDAGQYTLIASNNNSNSSHTLEIDVWYPPYDITELEDAQVSIRKDVVLKCSSNANPRPKYEWIYHQASNVQVKDQGGVSLLYITHAGGDNIGTYTCIAKNGLGEKKRMVTVNVQGAEPTCPLTISQQSVELEYGKSVNVTCTSSETNANLSWKFSNNMFNVNTLVVNSTWLINSLGWNGKASCHGQFVGLNNCTKDLNITIYKSPDQVSISTLARTGPMIEGENYTLLCVIQNVAPVQFLTVNWYKGQDLVQNEGFHKTMNRDNINTTLTIFPRRNSTMQYSCEAELKLGPESSPKVKSDPLNITVYSKPSINEEFQQWVPVFHGYPTVLTCKASGYPKPTIKWIFNNEIFKTENLTVTDNAGEYTCFASNSVGNDSRMVTVVMKEDYLPLIAGFVALVVVIISVVFICIYSIYYKNTKMGHYTVEGAKPKAQNSNIAQNGKDSTIPMKKIMV